MKSFKIQRLGEVLEKRGRSRSAHYADIQQGLFTKPVLIGARAVGWPEYETIDINAARIAGKSNKEIRALVCKLETDRKANKLPPATPPKSMPPCEEDGIDDAYMAIEEMVTRECQSLQYESERQARQMLFDIANKLHGKGAHHYADYLDFYCGSNSEALCPKKLTAIAEEIELGGFSEEAAYIREVAPEL